MTQLLIIDLESTCYEKTKQPPYFFSEIIEFGAVVFDVNTLKQVEGYQTFVRPTLFPQLSPFCKSLTTITQEQVETGKSIETAITELNELSRRTKSIFSSWGFYDQRQTMAVCRRFQLKYPFLPQHINLKQAHKEFYQLKRPLGMKQALQYLSLNLSGTHHRGIDDAKNIAKIANQMIEDGWDPLSSIHWVKDK
ncbi:3'-5' exonuclease [Hazenella coriacea]|uniref:Inhibitor of KinA sporulation pathway (Predicted exonuclease) n=1 Tax=Hazenella coriacea TaxID=1179467 RepID=A0A4R3L0Q0_9BACL|nr:3'-5' exonuclease [Hazenella coriacea]TCS92066.1 inhibitor of KinA sporulation pathway (predicted exonuclease) [Hazenella coriacea]